MSAAPSHAVSSQHPAGAAASSGHEVRDRSALRSLYGPAAGRSLAKQMAALDVHARRFIALSPFFVLSTAGADGRLDASPRGGPPGWVQVERPAGLAEAERGGDLLIPDSPGNNRLDSLENLVERPECGLLFMIPGVDETLRVNGRATLSTDPALLARCADARRTPKLVIRVAVHEAYLHCAKAFMRSKLWSPEAQVERSALPTMAQMIRDQSGQDFALESQEAMRARYQADL